MTNTKRKPKKRKIDDSRRGIRKNQPTIAPDVLALLSKWHRSADKKRFHARFSR